MMTFPRGLLAPEEVLNPPLIQGTESLSPTFFSLYSGFMLTGSLRSLHEEIATITFRLKNGGHVDGTEVSHIYIRQSKMETFD